MWHLDYIYHGKERKDMCRCHRALAFVFPRAKCRCAAFGSAVVVLMFPITKHDYHYCN